jgi:hypothetical protein
MEEDTLTGHLSMSLSPIEQMYNRPLNAPDAPLSYILMAHS